MRWLWLFLLAACCGSQSASRGPDAGMEPDLRCAEDCGSQDAVFFGVEHSVASTGEDSWLCYCVKGSETIRLW